MTSTTVPNILEERSDYQQAVSRWTQRFSHVEWRVELLDFAPPSDMCRHCGATAKRHQTVLRGPILDASLDCVIFIMVKHGIYCCTSRSCRRGRKRGRSFRKTLPFTGRRGRYTYRARQLGIDGVKLDGLPFTKVVEHLARVVHIAPSRSTAWQWHKKHGDQAAADFDIKQWSVGALSGVVCVDEMYDGPFCLLVATDPLAKQTLGYRVVSMREESIDTEQAADFMRYLRYRGINPDVMVTDESGIYPKALLEVWPQAEHQLCLFHIIKHLMDDTLASVRTYVETLPKAPKRKPGRPRKDEVPTSPQEMQRDRVHKSRFLLLRNPFSPPDPKHPEVAVERAARLEQLLQDHPTLRTPRNFAVDVFSLFRPEATREEADAKRAEMLKNEDYLADSHLAHALAKLGDDGQFNKMITYTTYTNLNRTNNDVERLNRWMRKKLQAHYHLRLPDTIGNALALHAQQQKSPADGVPKLRRRKGAGPQ